MKNIRSFYLLMLLLCLGSPLQAWPEQSLRPRSDLTDRFDNWGVLGEGKIFRSKHLSSKRLRLRLNQNKVRSILCFAKCTQSETWIAQELNVQYFRQELQIPKLTLDDAIQIVRTLREAPLPLLLHCKAGADRTGMAAALYLYAIEKLPMKIAIQKALTLHYGHLGRWNQPQIYEVLDQYEKHFPQ